MKNLIKNKIASNVFVLLLGISTSFSLPPYNFFLINFVTLSLFYIFINNYEKKLTNKFNYFKYGWIFGFGYFISSLYWIAISLTFDESFKILIPISLILVPAFIGIFYGLATIFFSFFINKFNSIGSVLIFSVIFGTFEFIRGFILTGFPWNLFVYSFSKNLDFIQILSFIGTYSLNLLCITLFLLPALFILRNSRNELYFCLFFISLVIGLKIFGQNTLKSSDKFTNTIENLNIKIISSRVKIDRFYNQNNEYEILNDLIILSDPDKEKSTLFIWPEGIVTSTNLNEVKKFKDLFNLNFGEKHLIIFGINDFNNKNNPEIYNTLAVFDNNLDLIDYYHKNKLVPFGEFLPIERFLKRMGLKVITNNYQSFSKGKQQKIIFLNNLDFKLKFLPLICYEIIYTGKLSTHSDFDLIINISEDGWFGDSIGPHQHFAHAVFRSIEEGKNIIRSANNGTSALINPKGETLHKIESTQSGVINIKKLNITNTTLFSQKGNNMFFYLLGIYISLIFFLKRKK